MIELPEKHRKVKPLSRTHMMDIAKIIRNLPINDHNKDIIRRALADYFTNINPFFDRQRFVNLATGKLHADTKTEWNSFFKEE